MGSQLYEKGVLPSSCLEELCITKVDLVRKVHEEYIRAGAEVLETNTFGANAMRLEKHGLAGRVRELNEAAVKVAREAALVTAPGKRAFVVGAIGPSGYFLGDAIADDLAKVRRALLEQAESLVGAGVDGIVVETFRQTNELQIAIESAVKAARGSLPVIASASVDERSRMADGTTSGEIARLMKEWGASVVGVNCCDGPMNVLEAVGPMLDVGLPVWAVPNAGVPRRVDDRLVYVSTSEYFGVYARRMFKIGVKLVGGCCGTTPDHVRRIAAAARMAGAAERSALPAAAGDSDGLIRTTDTTESWIVDAVDLTGVVDAPPFADRSSLAGKIADGRFVVSVEVNPPIGLDPSKALAAARMLKAGGIDVVNIADGARAQARMGNLAMALRVQEQTGMETILHVCGRDRNLLATLAHLLAAHELGVKNLVIITGDPPKMGDFPDASAVYDLDSIGILKLATRLNHGVDPGGKSLGGSTGFVLATGAEPAALNYDRELSRLQQKKAAGAELVMTQPVYDPAVLDRFLKDVAPLGLPVLVGLLPLASYRNAEFLHNEVPGMQVPDAVRERMRKAGSGAQARKEGVAIAREMLAAVRSRVAGAYIMPPLERYELALEVVDGFLDVAPRSRVATGREA
jgi:homocysteine S-methyltransferase